MDNKINFDTPDKKKHIEGRLFVCLILVTYWLLIFSFKILFNLDIMKLSGVPTISPYFADLRVITSGLDCARLGYDPLINNPCDPWKRVMNYPRIWQSLEIFGIKQEHTFIIGIILAILFYFSALKFISIINKKEAMIYSLILLSPAFILAVERGNNDLLVFIILSVSLIYFIKNEYLFYSALLSCSLIKLYPFAAFSVCLKEKKKTFLKIIFIFGLLFSIYIIVTFRDIMLISEGTPRVFYYSYGCIGVINSLNYLLKHFFDIQIKHLYIASWVLIFFVLFAVYSVSFFKKIKITYNSNNLSSFRIGASIYVTTFILGQNFVYRLVFLFFTLPLLLEWIRTKSNLKYVSLISLLCIIFTCWLFFWELRAFKNSHLISFILGNAHLLLVSIFIFMLLNTLPNYIKEKLFLID